MRNKILGIFFLLCLLLPLMSAEIELNFPFNSEMDIKRPCFNNGTYCSASAECNLTLINPDSTTLVNNQVMTNQLSFHNYTVSKGANTQLGIISASMVCLDGNRTGADTFEIEVSGDGNGSNAFPLEFTIIAFGTILIALGVTKERLSLMKNAGAIILFVMGVVTIYPGYGTLNSSTLTGLGLGTVLVGIGFYFMIEDSFSRKVQEDSYDQDNVEEVWVDND